MADDGPRLLMVQMLEWLADRPRSYGEAIDAWRSTCPRHPVWDDALLDGLIRIEAGARMREAPVVVTGAGRAVLVDARR
jgi:hypothetical protein